jgi:NAD(P)-dependent dehydrogenase (short-subunit alcohol dehydrogenase family)
MKTALITGAASGIGAAVAEKFASEGFKVALFDIDEHGTQEMARRLGGSDVALSIYGDVSISDDAKRAVGMTFDAFHAIDVLVNNAGIELAGSVETLSVESWDRLLGVNLRGAFLMSKFAVPLMRSGSAIVNISSVHALTSYPERVAYDASKSGLLGLTRAMALDHGSTGIRVNAVCPGYIQTPLTSKWLSQVADQSAELKRLHAMHPVKRLGLPSDIAEAVFFLASERASFITGTSLVVDGGVTAAGK